MAVLVDFGVCRSAVVSVYEKPDYNSLQYNQLLFGDHYQVTSQKNNWLSILTAHDECGGWIHSSMHHSISQEYFEQVGSANYKITTDLTSSILYNKHPLTIVMGSIVPISNSELFKVEEQLAFNGESKSVNQKRDTEYLNLIARKYLSAPFQPGGKSPFGIDASGLIQMAYKITGYALPRKSDSQMKMGNEVENFNKASLGDLIFLTRITDGEVVPSLFLTDGKILLVDGGVKIEKIDSNGIKAQGQKKYTWEIVAVRRIF